MLSDRSSVKSASSLVLESCGEVRWWFCPVSVSRLSSFTALALLVGWREMHLACKMCSSCPHELYIVDPACCTLTAHKNASWTNNEWKCSCCCVHWKERRNVLLCRSRFSKYLLTCWDKILMRFLPFSNVFFVFFWHQFKYALVCELMRTDQYSQAICLLWLPYSKQEIVRFPFGIWFLWSPYVIGQTIIFLPCDFFLLFFFPCLISAVGDWMSTIFPHMVWP